MKFKKIGALFLAGTGLFHPKAETGPMSVNQKINPEKKVEQPADVQKINADISKEKRDLLESIEKANAETARQEAAQEAEAEQRANLIAKGEYTPEQIVELKLDEKSINELEEILKDRLEFLNVIEQSN